MGIWNSEGVQVIKAVEQKHDFKLCWYDTQVLDMLKQLNAWATPYELCAFYYGRTGEVPMSTECARRHLERLVINGIAERARTRSPWTSNMVDRYKIKRGQG